MDEKKLYSIIVLATIVLILISMFLFIIPLKDALAKYNILYKQLDTNLDNTTVEGMLYDYINVKAELLAIAILILFGACIFFFILLFDEINKLRFKIRELKKSCEVREG